MDRIQHELCPASILSVVTAWVKHLKLSRFTTPRFDGDKVVEEYFDSVPDEPDWSPRFNIAPTQPIPVVRQNPKEPIREPSLMHWGLFPSWAEDASGAARMINARSETAATLPAFRDASSSTARMRPTT